ncbi:MAG: manganese transporter permease [Gemmatimonadaceae bacterium]
MSTANSPEAAGGADPRTPLARRLLTYQAERFPLVAYLPLIALAAFAALAFSRAGRGEAGFVSPVAYLVCAFTLLAAFFLLRVADEHKDADTDRLHRSHLPVPRGLVDPGELRRVAAVAAAVAIAVNLLLAPVLLVPLGAAGVWIALMTREFFARDWLRARPAVYLLSHMLVMPLLLLYASSIDWLREGAGSPAGIVPFLAAVFASGLVLEVGRKIHAPGEERHGVETYSSAWGERRAALVWVAAVIGAGILVAAAGARVGGRWTPVLAPTASVLIALAALPFLRGSAARKGRSVETAAATWNLLAYALLALPWIERWLT